MMLSGVTAGVCLQLYKALLLIGLTQFVGGLFVKSWSMYLYNTFNKDKKVCECQLSTIL